MTKTNARGRWRAAVALTAAAALALAGCANMSETQKGTAKGAGIGAAVGAVIGAATGNRDDAAKGAVIGGGLGAAGGYIWSKRMQEQKAAMEQATQGTGVAVTQTPDNRLKLEVPSDISFDVGRAAIKPNFAPVLTQFASSLGQNTATSVTIIGHTDNTGSDAINNPLSIERAESTRDFLVGKGVSRARIATDGKGSREPVADNATQAGRDKNRRVEIFVAERAGAAPQ